jgi:hypothetical protein
VDNIGIDKEERMKTYSQAVLSQLNQMMPVDPSSNFPGEWVKRTDAETAIAESREQGAEEVRNRIWDAVSRKSKEIRIVVAIAIDKSRGTLDPQCTCGEGPACPKHNPDLYKPPEELRGDGLERAAVEVMAAWIENGDMAEAVDKLGDALQERAKVRMHSLTSPARMEGQIPIYPVAVHLDGWVSVKDRKPPKNKDILVYSFSEGIFSATWMGINLPADITHWMPLPLPPAREEAVRAEPVHSDTCMRRQIGIVSGDPKCTCGLEDA